jgi:tetratricopeptide (TPR) repeat protein
MAGGTINQRKASRSLGSLARALLGAALAATLVVVLSGWVGWVGQADAAGPGASSQAVQDASQLVKDGKTSEARTLLVNALKGNPLDHEAHFALAKIYVREQAYDKAAEEAERAVKLADSVAVYHLWLARASLGKAMKSGVMSAFMAARKGKDEYERTIALDPGNVEARFELCMYYLVAPGIVGGSQDKARANAAILESQSELYGAYAWASYWEKEKNVPRAESLLVKAVTIDTSSTNTALYGLGYFYERHEDPAKAAGVFKQILLNKPEDLVALFNLGRVYVDTKTNLDEAEAAFKTYIEAGAPLNGPDEATAHWQLGLAYGLQDKADSALVELRRAVELAPNVKQFKDALKQAEPKN